MAVQASLPSGSTSRSCPPVSHTRAQSAMWVPLNWSSHSGDLAAAILAGQLVMVIQGAWMPSLL
jgi:hypothetical protein